MKSQTYRTTAKFSVWTEETDDMCFWELFDSLEDAVSTHGDGCEVFKLEPKFLGKFKRKAEIVKIKVRKKKKN